MGTTVIEANALHMIEQALALRNAEPSKNLKNMKRKAFTGLIRSLKTIGLRPAYAKVLTLSACCPAPAMHACAEGWRRPQPSPHIHSIQINCTFHWLFALPCALTVPAKSRQTPLSPDNDSRSRRSIEDIAGQVGSPEPVVASLLLMTR